MRYAELQREKEFFPTFQVDLKKKEREWHGGQSQQSIFGLVQGYGDQQSGSGSFCRDMDFNNLAQAFAGMVLR